jgi:DNA-binding transcriptional ArsR family regulator
MPTEFRVADAADPEETLGNLLTYAELLNTPQLARLYVHALRHGPITIEAIEEDLDVPHSTAYKYVGELEEMGILVRNDEETPTQITVDPIQLTLETDHGEVVATPVLVDAIGRQRENDDIRVFVERQGIPKLAAALHYTLRVSEGELTQRTAANKLDVHPVEGTTVITALLDVVEEATGYDPYLES